MQIHELEKRVIVLHSGCPNPNAGLIELEMILQILKNHTSHSVEVFFAYFAYGQQDKLFNPGEINMAYTILEKLVNYYNVKKIYSIDAHFAGNTWVNNFPLVNVSAMEILKDYAQKKYPSLVYTAPDSGSTRRTGVLGAKKKRIHSYKTKNVCDGNFAQSVKGKDVGVIDDILETGGTLEHFFDACKKCGANKIIALITHGVLPSGIARIKNKYDGLYLTNSIATPESQVDVSKLIIKTILKS